MAYIVIPASTLQSRSAELDHVEQWAHVNNLKLNRAKSTEKIFSSSRYKRVDCHFTELSDISRVTTISILGLNVANHLSISEHASRVITNVLNRCMHSRFYAAKESTRQLY